MWLPLLGCSAPEPAAPPPDTARPPDTTEQVGEAPAPEDPSEAVFDDATIHDIELTMSAEAWADLGGNPWAENWHTAEFAWDGESVAAVGVRAFGYSSHVAGKPPMKLDFNREVEGQRWRDLETLKLRNSYYDASFIHDALEAWMLRQAGVPASRTGWARVWVNGVRVGLYTVMESVDDRFLKRNFGNADGPLYSIDGIRGHGLMPLSDPLAYFQYNTEVTGDGSDLVDITRIVAEGSDAELAAVLDVDAFWVESIVRTLAGSQDSFSADGNNFYLYNDPGVDADPSDLHGTWRIIPWDYNFDFTAFGLVPALSVEVSQPWATSDYAFDPTTGIPYVDVLMQRQVASRDLDATLAELITGPLAFPLLVAKIEGWRTLLAEDVALDPLGDATAFQHTLDDTLLYLHMRLSNELGAEVAECATLEPGATPVRDMSPTGSVGWGSLTADGWIWTGQPRACIGGDAPCFGLDVASEHFCTGLFAHAPSDVTITVPDGATHLRGAVGLQLFAQDCSNGVRFSVEQEGVTLWESGVLTSYSPAEDMGDVPVKPGPLRLLADPLGNYGCDTASWLDLRAVP